MGNTGGQIGAAISAAAAGGLEVSVNDSGANIGAGLNIPFGDALLGNVQAKYQTPGDSQIVLNFGLAYGF